MLSPKAHQVLKELEVLNKIKIKKECVKDLCKRLGYQELTSGQQEGNLFNNLLELDSRLV